MFKIRLSRNRWLLILSILVILIGLGIVRLKLIQPINVPAIQEIEYVKIVPSRGAGNMRSNSIIPLDLNNLQDKGTIRNILSLLKSGKKSKFEGMPPASKGMSLPYLIIETTNNLEIDIMTEGVPINQVLVSDNKHKGAFIMEEPELHAVLNDLFSRAASEK